MAAPGESRIARYYDWLSRFQSFAGRLGHKGGFDPLAVHRLLTPDRGGVRPADVVHDRVFTAIGPLQSPQIIDAGCGYGGTIFYLCARLGGQYDGLTLSRVQQSRAAREAARRGLSGTCRFHIRDYDTNLRDVAPRGVDVIVAIESLAHAAHPSRSIANLATALRPGGRLALVDDVPRDELGGEDPDFAAFRAGWSCPAIARDRTLAASFRSAGLSIEHDEDLTPLVPLRNPEQLERLIRRNRRWKRAFGNTAAGALVDSLYGGLMLERLYQRRMMRYRFVLGRLA